MSPLLHLDLMHSLEIAESVILCAGMARYHIYSAKSYRISAAMRQSVFLRMHSEGKMFPGRRAGGGGFPFLGSPAELENLYALGAFMAGLGWARLD